MTDLDTKALLDHLMARRGNSPEFILELEGYVDDLAGGELDGADKKYIRDLAKRLGKTGGGDGSEPAEETVDQEEDFGEGEEDRGEGEEDRGEGEEDRGEGEEDRGEEEDLADTRFARAKAAFHERFDPEALDPDAPDTALRREIYEEYWAELERIEDED